MGRGRSPDAPSAMTEPTPTPEPRPAGSLVRDVAVLVLVGIALGVAHNAYLLGSGPRAGLSWIKEERRLVKLEDVLPVEPDGGIGESAAPAQPAAGAPGASGSAANPGTSAPGPASTAQKPAAGAQVQAASPASTTPAPVSSPASAPSTDPPAVVATPPADVPAIPETREPLEVGIGIVRRLHAANAAVFVDSRTAGEYAEGHISGALHLSFDDVFKDPDLAKKFDDRGLPIVAYCGGGDCDLSRNLAFTLIDAGHKRVLVFLDGMSGWGAAGLPVTKGQQP
jgi:rhodanese-related sulfurtransferase